MQMTLGTINGYDVFVAGDIVAVMRGDKPVARETVSGLSAFVENARDLTLGWGQLPDDEVVYLYEQGDDGFGYAVNLSCPGSSEWGYAPFGQEARD